MSVILDALRKLDREKSSRQSGSANIAVDILRPDLPNPGRRFPFYVAVAFLTALATATITYSVMVKRGSPAKSSPSLAMNSPSPPPPAEAISPPTEPVREPRSELNPTPPKPRVAVKSKKPSVSLHVKKVDERKTSRGVTLQESDVAPRQTRIIPEQPPSQKEISAVSEARRPSLPAATRPSLNISTIVWYEEPSKRFAMINGLMVTEGSVVEGMKVEEIYPDGVRFLDQNQPFEIFIK